MILPFSSVCRALGRKDESTLCGSDSSIVLVIAGLTSTRHALRSFGFTVTGITSLYAGVAHAGPGTCASNGNAVACQVHPSNEAVQSLEDKLNKVEAGEKVFVQSKNGQIVFAGEQIQMNDFSGIMGFSADAAYIVAADGTASIGGLSATRGKMIIIPPLGNSPAVVRYDAQRLISHKSNADTMPTGLKEMFANAASAQSFGIFTGRFGRTNFNVAASGNAKDELARRSVVGGKALRKIRFAEPDEKEQIELRIIAAFAQALMDKDIESVSEFLDPLTFGGNNLNHGGTEARLLMAKLLISERDWQADLTGYEVQNSGGFWNVTGSEKTTRLKLRTTTDFVFVQSVQIEG